MNNFNCLTLKCIQATSAVYCHSRYRFAICLFKAKFPNIRRDKCSWEATNYNILTKRRADYKRPSLQPTGTVIGYSLSIRTTHLTNVCLSVHTELGSHWTDFHEILYLTVFRKSVGNIQGSLKSDKNKGHFTWRPAFIYDDYSLNSS